MATYGELRALFWHNGLQRKIEVACIVAAETIYAEPPATDNHANRLKWAKSVFKNLTRVGKKMMMAVLAANRDLTVAQITDEDDATLQTKVDAAIDLFVKQKEDDVMDNSTLDDIARGAILRRISDGRLVMVCEIEHFTGMPLIAKDVTYLPGELSDYEVLIPGDDASLVGTPKDILLDEDIWLPKELPSVDPTKKATELGVLNDSMYD